MASVAVAVVFGPVGIGYNWWTYEAGSDTDQRYQTK